MFPERRKPKSIFLDGRSWPLFHGIATLFLLALFALHWTKLDAMFDSRISSPILFQIRESLGETPQLNKRVKILALDDSTFSALGGPRLSMEQLDRLLKNIGDKKPKAILLDSLLADSPYSPPELHSADGTEIPVFSGNFMSDVKLKYRLEADLSADTYRPQTYLSDVFSLEHLSYKLDSFPGAYVYGHSRTYDKIVRGVGHITFNRDATISPFFLLSERTIMPHLSLFAADTIQLREDELVINGHHVPMTKAGRLMINHRNPMVFYERAMPLRFFVQRAMANQPETKIEEGDVVLILFAFATGNTDFHEGGPFGDIPGGIILASTISDIIDGTWLGKWEVDGLLIMAFGFIGIIVGINLSIRRYLAAIIGVWVCYSAFVVSVFVYGSVWCPWALPMFAFTGTSLIHFVHVRIYEEMKLMLIERNYQAEKAKRLQQNRRKSS